MDHAEAVKSQVAEKYLLGELSDSEAEQFEQHYFACPECAADLEAGTLFVENARAVFRERSPTAAAPAPPAVPVPRRDLRRALAEFWRRPAFAVPAFASIALAVLAVYQGLVVIPGLKRAADRFSSPLSIATFQLVQAARGDARPVSVPAGTAAFALSFDPTWETAFPQYRCELRDPSGLLVWQLPALPPAPGRPITILVPADRLRAGTYSLAVSGIRADGSQQPRLATYSFAFRFH